MKEVTFLAGLPRSGSTVLSNILGSHPDIHATPSSPLCGVVQGMRNSWSQDPFFKAQLDDNFEVVSERLRRTTRATIEAWSDDSDKDITIDKNRGWLFGIEWLRELYPDFKMIVTIRDLRNIYASIEKRHRQTLMLNFPDNLEHNIVDVRAKGLFDDGGILGSCLKAINNIGDIPEISNHLLIWRYEDFVENPQQVTDVCFNFLGVEPKEIDFNNIEQVTHESDSYYNMKFSHEINSEFKPAEGFEQAKMSPRIVKEIEGRFEWYYRAYYPEFFAHQADLAPGSKGMRTGVQDETVSGQEQTMIEDLERAIKKETE